MGLTVRATAPSDVPDLCAIINEIIAIGGTTAHETPFTPASFSRHFLEDVNFVCSFTALSDGELAGFQSLYRSPDLPYGWGDIGTFARVNNKVAGVGTALFAHTKAFARTAGLISLNATIRADNVSGLAYYSKMGFTDYAVKKNVPLKNGQLVDRISKQFKLVEPSA